MAVRYDQEFMNEIRRTVNAYNRKINRLSKLDTNYILPEKFSAESLKALKATATTRGEVRRRLKDLQSFTARGGEKNIRVGKATIPQYQYTNIKRYRRILSNKINKKIKQYQTTYPVTSGKREKFTFAEQGSDEYLTLLAKKEKLLGNLKEQLGNMSEKDIDMFVHKLRVNAREYDLVAWQNNYIDIFQDTALSYGYDTEKLDTIVWALQRLTPEQFDELAFEDRNIKAVLTHYKSLIDIKTAAAFEKDSETVINNLDEIYNNLSGILSKINNE